MARLVRTVSPQSFKSSLSSSLTFMVLAWSPADRTASFQLGKHRETEYSEIPASETNSERVGARPSPLAMALMESKICWLSDIGSLLWSAAACLPWGSKGRGLNEDSCP